MLRLDEPDPSAAWEERMAVLNSLRRAPRRPALRRDRASRPGDRLTVGLLPTHTWWAADFSTADGLRHFPNLPTEEVFTTPDPSARRVM